MPFTNTTNSNGNPLVINQYYDDSNSSAIPIPGSSNMITEAGDTMIAENSDIMITE